VEIATNRHDRAEKVNNYLEIKEQGPL